MKDKESGFGRARCKFGGAEWNYGTWPEHCPIPLRLGHFVLANE